MDEWMEFNVQLRTNEIIYDTDIQWAWHFLDGHPSKYYLERTWFNSSERALKMPQVEHFMHIARSPVHAEKEENERQSTLELLVKKIC